MIAVIAIAETGCVGIVFCASLNRPEENITGVTWFGGDLAGKRIALARCHSQHFDHWVIDQPT